MTYVIFFTVVTVGIIGEDEARELFDMCVISSSGLTLYVDLQAAAAFTMDVQHFSPFLMPRLTRMMHFAADRHSA